MTKKSIDLPDGIGLTDNHGERVLVPGASNPTKLIDLPDAIGVTDDFGERTFVPGSINFVPVEPEPPDNRPGYLMLRTVSTMYVEFISRPGTAPLTVSVRANMELRQLVAAVRSGEVLVKNRSDLRPARIDTMSDAEIAECRISRSDAERYFADRGHLSAEEVARMFATAPPATDHAQQIETTDEQTTNAETVTAAAEWKSEVRKIADEFHAQDLAGGAWSSLSDMAGRVAVEARERGIRGPHGQLTAGNILREALQGKKWKRPD